MPLEFNNQQSPEQAISICEQLPNGQGLDEDPIEVECVRAYLTEVWGAYGREDLHFAVVMAEQYQSFIVSNGVLSQSNRATGLTAVCTRRTG